MDASQIHMVFVANLTETNFYQTYFFCADFDGDGFIGKDDICMVVSRITNDAANGSGGGGDVEERQGDEETTTVEAPSTSKLTASDIDKIAKNVSVIFWLNISD